MPEIGYIGTITFDPNLDTDKKNEKIEKFPKLLSQYLNWKGDRRYYLAVAKEYHKVDGQDDFDAPHLHFILYCESKLPAYRVRAIQSLLRDTCGRSTFHRATPLKTASYAQYIQKDFDRLLNITGIPHYFEMNLEEEEDILDYENIIDDFYDEF